MNSERGGLSRTSAGSVGALEIVSHWSLVTGAAGKQEQGSGDPTFLSFCLSDSLLPPKQKAVASSV